MGEWAISEEGRKSIEEWADIKRKCKAATAELAAVNVAPKELSQQNEIAHTSPTKVANGASAFELKETPVKQRRVVCARAPSNEEPLLDEKVVEEAGKVGLLAQLRNLASRPEVLALQKSSQKLLDALKANDGLVNAAKRSLVGA